MKKLPIIFSTVVAIAIIVFSAFMILKSGKVVLDDDFYSADGVLVDITTADLSQKISDHKSFVVFAYQPGCRASEDFENLVLELAQNYHLQIFRLPFSELKDGGYVPGLKYYPSLVIFEKGKSVSFLDADSNADTKAFTSYSALADWWNAHIEFGD